MDATVFFAVLFAAVLHASWNAIVKNELDRLLSITLITLAAGGVALALTPGAQVECSGTRLDEACGWRYL